MSRPSLHRRCTAGITGDVCKPTSNAEFRRRSSSFPSKEMLHSHNSEMCSVQKRLCLESGYIRAYTSIIEDIKKITPTTQDTQSKTNSKARQKKRKLRLSVSCPPFTACDDTNTSPTSCSTQDSFIFEKCNAVQTNSSSRVPNDIIVGPPSSNSRYSPQESYTRPHMQQCSDGSNLRPPAKPITYQPGSADYIAFIKQSQHIHDDAIKYIDYLKTDDDCAGCLSTAAKRIVEREERAPEDPFKYLSSLSHESDCANCLRSTKNIVSWCTCHWCLMSLCYHCVYRDDVGYNAPGIRDAILCEGSSEQNLKRAAIMLSCLPCFPCLSLYPVLSGILNFCLKFS